MPKKLVKKIVVETIKEPAKVVEKAAEQTGVILPRETGPELSQEELAEKKRKDEAFTRRQSAKLDRELKEITEEKKAARIQAQRAEELRKEEENIPTKQLIQPKPKRPRQFLYGLKQRLAKTRPETAGRRVGG